MYDDDEKMLISIFYELGHKNLTQDFIKSWHYNTFIIELECWNIGIKIAKDFGIFFSDNAIKWGYEQAFSYSAYDERELIEETWEEKRKKLWIHQNLK